MPRNFIAEPIDRNFIAEPIDRNFVAEPYTPGGRDYIWIPLFGNIDAVYEQTGWSGLGTHVRASSAVYTHPLTGLITTVGNNIPRFESAGGLSAILLEPGSKNWCTDSEVFRAAISSAWGNTRCSVTDDADTAPDGNATADKLVEDVTGITSHYANDIVVEASFTNDTKVTFTVYAKQAERTWVFLLIRTKANNNYEGYFDLANGVVGSKSATATTSIEAEPFPGAWNGFYRCRITHDIENGVTNPQFWIATSEPEDYTYAGDGSSGIYIWGAQVEEFPVPTSYIATSGATASRATESSYPLWTLPTGLFDAIGTCVVWVRFGWGETDMLQDGTRETGGIVAARDNQVSLMQIEHDSDFGTNTRPVRSADGTNIANVAYDIVVNTWYKLVIKWGYDVGGAEKMRAGIDIGAGVVWGVEQSFDGAYDLGASLRLAYNIWGPFWLRDLRIYDTALTDAAINDLGSP